MKRLFFLFLLFSFSFTVHIDSASAQSNILTTSGNFRNQSHRNLLGQCSATLIDCGPMTANPGGGAINGPQSLQRVDAVAPGEIRCVSGFGTADGTSPGGTSLGTNDTCLTTSGVLWAGFNAMSAGSAPFSSSDYPFTGLPRIPVGADTQFGVGAKSNNRLDIRGTTNDSPVPTGSSTGVVNFNIRRDFKDSLTTPGFFGSAYPNCSNENTDCQTAFSIVWSAPKPLNCPASGTGATCPNPTIDGIGFHSAEIACPIGITGPCRQHEMRYGVTQKWVGGIAGGEGGAGFPSSFSGGGGMQEFILSFSVVSQTNGNGDLISDPTGYYYSEVACIGSSGSSSFAGCQNGFMPDINQTTPRFVGSVESGSFSTSVTFPGGIPTVGVTLTQDGGSTGSGCQHDSFGTSCIGRSGSFLP